MNELARLFKGIFAFVFLCVSLSGVSHAELLQRLHVDDFKLTTDTPRPKVGVPFHVTLTVRTRERVTQPQYVYMPALFGFDKLGDQRNLTRVPDGWIYRETLTLVSHKPGPTAIGSAYLDAVDLSDSKTKRFSSNDLILNVMGSAVASDRARINVFLLLLLGLLILAAAAFFVAKMLRRRRPAIATSLPEPRIAARPPPAMGLDEAFANLQNRRDRASVLNLREALWYIAGAHHGETLAEVLRREPARGDGLRGILIAVEHAAFVDETRLQHAIDNALSEGEHVSAR